MVTQLIKTTEEGTIVSTIAETAVGEIMTIVDVTVGEKVAALGAEAEIGEIITVIVTIAGTETVTPTETETDPEVMCVGLDRIAVIDSKVAALASIQNQGADELLSNLI